MQGVKQKMRLQLGAQALQLGFDEDGLLFGDLALARSHQFESINALHGAEEAPVSEQAQVEAALEGQDRQVQQAQFLGVTERHLDDPVADRDVDLGHDRAQHQVEQPWLPVRAQGVAPHQGHDQHAEQGPGAEVGDVKRQPELPRHVKHIAAKIVGAGQGPAYPVGGWRNLDLLHWNTTLEVGTGQGNPSINSNYACRGLARRWRFVTNISRLVPNQSLLACRCGKLDSTQRNTVCLVLAELHRYQ